MLQSRYRAGFTSKVAMGSCSGRRGGSFSASFVFSITKVRKIVTFLCFLVQKMFKIAKLERYTIIEQKGLKRSKNKGNFEVLF
jgi:hypothetical protein